MMAKPPETYPEDVREAFEYCEACEKVIVSVDQHTCSGEGGSGHKSAAERAQLAALDDRPRDEDVLYPKGRSTNNAWAYHELDEDGDPLHELDHRSGSEIAPRAEAIDQGCFPCGQCRLIQEAHERRGEDDG